MRRFLWVVVGMLFFVSATTVTAYAETDFATHEISKDKQKTAKKYWTKERKKNAKPYPPRSKKTPAQRSPANGNEQLEGPPQFDPGYEGETDPSSRFKTKPLSVREPLTKDDLTEDLSASAIGYTFPAPHTTFPVLGALYDDTATPYPYKAIGKIFFTEDGEDYVCSGASIGGRAVLTAGHCVSNGEGVYHSNWTFVPAYQEENEPFGEWTAFWLATFTAYHQGGDLGRDVGFAAVKDLNGKKLSQRVGALGFASSVSRTRHWNMFGYPADDPWDGEFMVETQASYAYVDDTVTPSATGIGTSQTGGCSGGPWILNFKPGSRLTSKNLANGVNSYADEDGEIYSPYFNASVKSLKDKAVAK